MVRNEQKYQEAVRLRERGFTLAEIAKYCDVSKSTVSKWLKNNAMSAVVTKQNIRRAGQENAKRLKLVSKARSSERAHRYREVVHSATTEFKHFKHDPLFIAGVMLYRAHGDLQDTAKVRFSTTDSIAHGLFIKFLKEYTGIQADKPSFWLQLYPQHSEEQCMRHWKKRIGLPYAQFNKSQVINLNSRKKPLHYGVGNTIIGSTVLQRKLRTWCELLLKNL